MTIEYNPVGIACNLKCAYCYQDPMRDAGNITTPKNWERVKQTLDAQGGPFSVFGGEALLTPIDQLETIFAYGFEKHGKNSIQTNGVLITKEHIKLFLKYKVSVGVSIDGDAELNSVRCNNEETLATLKNVQDLIAVGIIPSLIVTLHRNNADKDKLPLLLNFFSMMGRWGIKWINPHLLESDSAKVKKELALTDKENIEAFRHMYPMHLRGPVVFSVFRDIENQLIGEGESSCIWNACDPLTTRAVRGVSADGTLSNCGRTNKDGVNWQKASEENNERYLALYNTPVRHNGCQGCKFFFACKGQCPGTAIDGDWRNRTEHCQVWFHTIDMVHRELLSKGRTTLIESGKFEEVVKKILSGSIAQEGHGDSPHGDRHGDSPHGDAHGDSDLKTAKTGTEVSWRS